VTIRRLRPRYTDGELAHVYEEQYDHTRWPDHVLRVEATVDFIRTVTTKSGRRRVADLSCGDAAIARAVPDVHERYLGDLVHNDEYDFHGRIEDTVHQLPVVDLFILSETLEHLDDPWRVLELIRERAHRIVLTTPLDERDGGNPEHYWGWDEDGVRSIMETVGWAPTHYEAWTPQVKDPYYTFQFWSAI